MGWIDAGGLDLRVVGIVSGGHFFSHFYLLAFPPLFPILAAEFALSNVQLGLIMSAVQVGTFLQVFAGDVVDRVGGKRVFVLGVAVTAAGIGLAGLATSYLLIVLFALVASVGQSAFHPADYALLDAASDDASEGKSFGLHNFAGSLGFAAGPAVVGGIALAAGWQTALLVAGGLGLAYALFAHLAMEDGHLARMGAEEGADGDDGADDGTGDGGSGGSRWADLGEPTLLALFAFFCVVSLGGFGFHSFTTVLVDEGFALSEATGNTALTAFFTLSAFGVLAGGVIADRLRPRQVILPALLGSAGLTWAVAAGLVPAVPTLVVATFACIGGIFGLLIPSRDRLVNAAVARGSTGRSFGFVFTGISLAGVVSPTVLGAVIDASSVWVAFWLVGGSFVAAAGIALVVATDRAPGASPAPGSG
jgi:MFS family permease